jgi:hypothetical protein
VLCRALVRVLLVRSQQISKPLQGQGGVVARRVWWEKLLFRGLCEGKSNDGMGMLLFGTDSAKVLGKIS